MAATNQKNVTLSPRAHEEYEEVAKWLGMPAASLMRQVLEQHHQSPEFDTLLKRARSEDSERWGDRTNTAEPEPAKQIKGRLLPSQIRPPLELDAP
jgi:hypothetical protein